MSETNNGIPIEVTPTIELQAHVEMGGASSENNAEAWAVGERGGVPVSSTDQTYHNNSKYYAEAARDSAATASAAYNVNLLAPNYDATASYAVGDHVIYNGGYYECISAISSGGESWTSAHWRALTVGGEASDLKLALSNYGGTYRSDCFIEAETNKIRPASGDGVRTAIIQIVPNCKYSVLVTGNDRLRVGLTNTIYNGSQINNVYTYKDDTASVISFSSQGYKYAYIQVSGSGVDCPMFIGYQYENEIRGTQLYHSVFSTTENLFDGTYTNTCFVNDQSQIAKSSTQRSRTAIIPLVNGYDYHVVTVGNDTFRIALTKELVNYDTGAKNARYIIIDDNRSAYSFNANDYNYAYINVSGNAVDCPLLVTCSYDRINDLLSEQGNIFDGTYTYLCFVDGQGKIKTASGNTARTAIIPVEPHQVYELTCSNNDRFAVALADRLYNSEEFWGSLVIKDDTKNNCIFNTGNYKYLYAYVSNSSIDCPLNVRPYKNSNANKSVTVKDFGAVGDGTTDDTDALEIAMEYCFENRIPVVFPDGTYMIRRPLTLRSYMEIYGIGKATVKKKESVTTTLTEALATNGTVLHVASVTGFSVGDYILISSEPRNYPAARHCSVGYITAINSTNLTITFKSAYDGIKTGAIKNHAAGCYVTNSCAIFRSWGMWYDCEHVYIHDLTLDGNRVTGEFGEWSNGCIHMDAAEENYSVEGITYNKKGNSLTCRNLTILNAPFDAISDQSAGNGLFENCTIKNPYMHGIHFGTVYANANVTGCEFYETENGSAVFWCQGVTDIVVNGNRFFNCHKGCSDYEYGTEAQTSIISNNIFDNIESYVFDFSIDKNTTDKGKIVISGNIIINVNETIGNFIKRENISFTDNVVDDFNTVPSNLFTLTNSDKLLFSGNMAYGASGIFSNTPTHFVNSGNSWN